MSSAIIMLAAMALAYAACGVAEYMEILALARRQGSMYWAGRRERLGLLILCVVAWPVLRLAGANGKDQGE
jgi:hypothetical protein